MTHDPTHQLVRMANGIGDFFAAMPDEQEAIDGIAGHLRKFWEPRMRRQIYAWIDAGGDGLNALVLRSLQAHREVLRPADAAPPAPPAHG